MIHDYYKEFSDVHPNIILKADLNRQGVRITDKAKEVFKNRDDIHWKGYHFFSYDVQDPVFYTDHVPATFSLEDGCTIYERTNENSPYSLDYQDGRFVISEKGEIIADNIRFPPKPKWYDMKLDDGTPMQAIVNAFCGELLFVTFNKYCEFWNTHDECLFCDINAQMRGQTESKQETVVARKDPSIITTVLKVARSLEPQYWCLYISGGTILKKYRGQTEIEFYVDRLNAIREGLGGTWFPAGCQIAAQNDENWKRLHETGVPSIQPNIEVWGEELFNVICPGKAKSIGWDNWIKRTIRAVDFWGVGKISPNFVLGVELCRHGFKDVRSAVENFASGMNFLMDHGVVPRYAYWTIEPKSQLAGDPIPPLEFFIEAEKTYTEIRWRHGFDPPFPGVYNRFYQLSCIYDFEYYHGSGPLSKKWQDERGGPKEHEICAPGGGFGWKV